MKRKVPDLPESKDKEFWGDAETTTVMPETRVVAKEHRLEWRGPYAVCTSCAYEHTIPVDFTKYRIINGNLVKK